MAVIIALGAIATWALAAAAARRRRVVARHYNGDRGAAVRRRIEP